MVVMADIFPQVGQGAQMPLNPSLVSFSDVCIGFYHAGIPII